MAAMDLRTNQEVMGMQNRYPTEYGSHLFKARQSFEEADIKGNNNLFNSLKTEANSNHSHDPSSLFQVNGPNKKNLEVDNSLFSYSSFKKAMDLRTHNRTLDGGGRTIFDDAEHFAKNYCYKLLPITFEQVDETIIQSEHNYSLFSLTSESEPEEDCSRMMDYSQIKEKNYKRRRTKFREGSDEEEAVECWGTDGDGGRAEGRSGPTEPDRDVLAEAPGCPAVSPELEPNNPAAAQPLDLSAAPSTVEEKTDACLRERPNGSPEKDDCGNEEIVQLDSDKENANAEPNGIRVTITRPDEKENYQPCDLFLNDIARLVPWLIDKDCLEVDILDRTCDRHDEFRKHRLYYVVAESTWRLFQRTKERVILTNDQSLGQPLRKAEKEERPSYLVFDQFSLAKCLAEHCQEIGGCFEYTCVEEGKDAGNDGEGIIKTDAVEEVGEMETADDVEIVGDATDEGTRADREANEKARKVEELWKNLDEELQKAVEGMREEKEEATQVVESPEEDGIKPEKVPDPVEEKPETEMGTAKEIRVSLPAGKTKEELKTGKRRASEIPRPKTKPPTKPKPKSDRMTTRSKSTSESETSQKSDKRVSTRGRTGKRGGSAQPGAEPPNKIRKRTPPESSPRKTRSGKVLDEDRKTTKPAEKEGAGGKRTPGGRGVTKKTKERTSRSLRSQKGTQGKQEEGGRKTRARGRRR